MNWSITKNDYKHLIALMLVSLLFTLPIIISNVYYRDDLDRVITGYYGWSFAARPLADILMMLISGSGIKLVDYAPYSTIIASAMVAVAAFIIKKFLDSKEVANSTFIAALFIINPLFLQNLLYRYDSLPMSMALACAVASYFLRLRNIYASHTIRALLAVASLSLYQPCFNIFIALLSVELTASLLKRSSAIDSVKITIKRGLEYAAYYSIYFISVGMLYASNNARAKFIGPNEEGLRQILSTKTRLTYMIGSLGFGPNFKYIAFGLASAVVACVYLLISRKVKPLSFIVVTIISIVAMGVSLLGPTYLLMNSPVLPRAVVSLSVPLVILGVILTSSFSRIYYLAAIPAIPMFAFSAQVSNAIHDQRKYEENILSMAGYDILSKGGDYSMVKIVGSPAYSPRSKTIIEEHPSVKYILSVSGGFQASFIMESIGIARVQPSYGQEEKNMEILSEMKEDPSRIISKTDLYSVYKRDGIILVDIAG
ncbi:glucosyltransferase domain-containing protein [Escherichia coli]